MSLGRNMVWNVAGMLAPMLVAVLAVPVMLSRLGPERFGVVSIAWVLIGYFGVLDLGLGRALTHGVARLSGRAHAQRILAKQATSIMVVLGMAWAVLVWVAAKWIVAGWLKLPAEMAGETVAGLRLLAIAVPFVMFVNARLALLEGLQRFRLLGFIRIPLGALIVLAPMGVSLISTKLNFVLGAIVLIRIAAAGMFWLWPTGPLPSAEGGESKPAKEDVWALFRFGGWLSVTNIVGPLITYCDRFYVAAVLGAAAVAYYATPYDVLVRLTALPVAMLAVLFPFMSALRLDEHVRLAPALRRVLALMTWGWGGGLALAILLGPDVLRWWVGSDVAGKSLPVWDWLILGVFANGFAFIPYNLIQSLGRTDLTAKFHLLELPIYAVLLVSGIHYLGIMGAAMAWSVRAVLDAALLYIAAGRMSRDLRGVMWRGLGLVVAGLPMLLFMRSVDSSTFRWALAVGVFITCGGFCLHAWMQWRRVVRI